MAGLCTSCNNFAIGALRFLDTPLLTMQCICCTVASARGRFDPNSTRTVRSRRSAAIDPRGIARRQRQRPGTAKGGKQQAHSRGISAVFHIISRFDCVTGSRTNYQGLLDLLIVWAASSFMSDWGYSGFAVSCPAIVLDDSASWGGKINRSPPHASCSSPSKDNKKQEAS